MAQLKDLPVEIRTEIWAEALANADTDGMEVVYYFDPEDFGMERQSDGRYVHVESDWESEPEVVLAFPAIMHVCHESREYAKKRLSFREDTVMGIEIPCRPYRPETDAFFIHTRHHNHFLTVLTKAQDDEDKGKLQEGEKAFHRGISRLGISSPMLLGSDIGDVLASFVPEMTALRHLCFVFGNIYDLDVTRPLRMYEWWLEDETEVIHGVPGTKVHVQGTLDRIRREVASWEVSDESTAPWDEENGEWLFVVEAGEISQVKGWASL
ncbi:hypothetical protein KVR01_013455 [Diaporthe batatas]|uniref:uncharacterized protein n=1 Tax=Diaporthe batatas TaxID=748121 RepID=UPI001D050892|nr:uncharacterized protein KVR01_013455 [Diaporthe batatas]KAG8156664.1 hypothetical protein KVR01_013455 [Diaporthe batatas]